MAQIIQFPVPASDTIGLSAVRQERDCEVPWTTLGFPAKRSMRSVGGSTSTALPVAIWLATLW